MLNFLFFSLAPFGAQAFYPYNDQTPLIPNVAPSFMILLELENYRNYRFQSTSSSTTLLDLSALHHIVGYGATSCQPTAVSINIPLDVTAPASMSIGAIPAKYVPNENDQTIWIETTRPGEDMPLSQVGIRKGGMVTIEARTARLALETPFVFIPQEIYRILLMATEPVFHSDGTEFDEGVVDCNSRSRFPDLVLGLELEFGDDEEQDAEEREIVITPEEYIMEVEQGKCVLLARCSGENQGEEVVLGWAATRGREVILDWVNKRTGFEW